MIDKFIQIAHMTLEYHDLDSLIVIQGNLKSLTQDRYLFLKNQIIKNRFNDPFQVWRDKEELKIIGGTQRKITLLQMREEGYDIPKLPCLIVEADNEKQAREMILSRAAQAGIIDMQELAEFAQESEIDFLELKQFPFPDINWDEFFDMYSPNGEQKEEKEKKKLKCPKCDYEW